MVRLATSPAENVADGVDFERLCANRARPETNPVEVEDSDDPDRRCAEDEEGRAADETEAAMPGDDPEENGKEKEKCEERARKWEKREGSACLDPPSSTSFSPSTIWWKSKTR